MADEQVKDILYQFDMVDLSLKEEENRSQSDREFRASTKGDFCSRVLKKTQLGRVLLEKHKQTPRVANDRHQVALKVLEALLEEDPARGIKRVEFQDLAEELATLFPGTEPNAWFIPYRPKTEQIKQRNAGGPLYHSYNWLRKQFRTEGILSPSSRSSSSRSSKQAGTSLHQVQKDDYPLEVPDKFLEDISFLERSTHPWKVVEASWKRTFQIRQKILKSESTFVPYFQRFKSLNCNQGYRLILNDFNELYSSAASPSLFHNQLYSLSERIIKTSVDKVKHLSSKNEKILYGDILEKLQGEPVSDRERKDLLLLLFPLICPHPGNVIKQVNKKKFSKASYEEIRSTFAKFIPEEKDLQETLCLLRNRALTSGETIQPFIIYTGSQLNVKSAWVIVDQIFYKFNSLCEAVDCTLKIFFALDACYPAPAKTVWGVLAKILLNIGEVGGSAGQFVIDLQTKLSKVVSEPPPPSPPTSEPSSIAPSQVSYATHSQPTVLDSDPFLSVVDSSISEPRNPLSQNFLPLSESLLEPLYNEHLMDISGYKEYIDL
ncbi:unnamed protein product [Brassicogethes aeneus]|uniref:Uncharacterized protein n=1 Tax=Brassicogethes aeneus TaxID=1431903 RepID=A0A9P0FLS8_BRAAE|nr:unnamed protein product [Brassicogethes aeneus]